MPEGRRVILVTGTEAILTVDADTGMIIDKQSHDQRTCEAMEKEERKEVGCNCDNVKGLNQAYSEVRKFNLNDRTRDLYAGEIDILYIGYETWEGKYERPQNEFTGTDERTGFITDYD